MNAPRRVLIIGGLVLAAWGMLYGLHYAVFVEHQTLDRMGGSLATAFSQAASGSMTQAHDAIGVYGSTKYDYVRQVDAHSHWVGLAMVLIVLGVIFDRVGFSSGTRSAIAWALVVGSATFPMGFILQTARPGSAIFSGMAIAGSGLVILGMAATAAGFAMNRRAS